MVYKAKVYSNLSVPCETGTNNGPDGSIVAKIPGFPVDIPLITLIRALGLESDKILQTYILNSIIQDELEPSFEKAGEKVTSSDALYI